MAADAACDSMDRVEPPITGVQTLDAQGCADDRPGGTMETLKVKLEAVMALLVTFLVAIVVMGSMNGLSALEPVVALVQALAAFALYDRWATPR